MFDHKRYLVSRFDITNLTLKKTNLISYTYTFDSLILCIESRKLIIYVEKLQEGTGF